MTIVEFFQSCVAENLCTSIVHTPDRVVLLGYQSKNTLNVHKQRYEEFFEKTYGNILTKSSGCDRISYCKPALEKSRSWSSARDWKSRNRQKRFEGSNPSFSAKTKKTVRPLSRAVFFVLMLEQSGIRTHRVSRVAGRQRLHAVPLRGDPERRA